MANREENLKKINVKLEMMSGEELENISGGSCGEIANDSRFLNLLLAGTKDRQRDRYGSFKLFWSDGARLDIMESWASLGILAHLDKSSDRNQYFLNKKEISRAEAWIYAEEKVGKHLTEPQWNW